MRLLSKETIVRYMREREQEHAIALIRPLNEEQKQKIEKQKRHMNTVHDKIQRED